MAEKGLRPRTVGRTEFTHKQPLRHIDKVMSSCAGIVVIALERLLIERGFDKRGSTEEHPLSDVTVATPWAQIKSAFAYAKGKPILVVRQDNVRADGLLEGRYDWYVYSTPLDPAFLSEREFNGVFDSWHKEVRHKVGFFSYRQGG